MEEAAPGTLLLSAMRGAAPQTGVSALLHHPSSSPRLHAAPLLGSDYEGWDGDGPLDATSYEYEGGSGSFGMAFARVS